MKNSLYLALLAVLLLSGCVEYFAPKPTINVYYIQDENRTNYPRVKTQGEHVSISTKPEASITNSKKIQLYFVYKEGCPACEQMKQLMRRDDIETILDRDFEITRVNIRDKDALPKVWMRPFRAPTFYFLDQKQEELISSIHNMSAERFLTTLKEAVQARDPK
jgi:thioredoxin-related protein